MHDHDDTWYCIRSKPKQEHIAAAHLRMLTDTEVFCPRLRFQRLTRTGRKWFTEALFPSYFFARFDLTVNQRAVLSAQGVSGIVRFGQKPAVVPTEVIGGLRTEMDHVELRVVAPDLQTGDAVVIAGGALHGFKTVVTQLLPAGERVRVLFELLGRTVEVELPQSTLLASREHFLAANCSHLN